MKERMLRGELYIADDPGLAADYARAQELLERYNTTPHAAQDERDRILRELLGSVATAWSCGLPSGANTERASPSAPGRSSTSTA